MSEQRIYPRVDVSLEVQYHPVPEFIDGRSMNISRGGIYICTPHPLPRDRKILLRVPLPGAAQPVQVTGIVIWSNPGTSPSPFPPGMGVKFLDLTDADAALIADFVAKKQKQAAPPPPSPPPPVSVTASSLGIRVLATPPAASPPPPPAEPLPITLLPEEPPLAPAPPAPGASEPEIPAHVRRQMDYMMSLQSAPRPSESVRPAPPAAGPASPPTPPGKSPAPPPAGQPGPSSQKPRVPQKPDEKKP
jgi:uncharacterized protein (TIGR02266 family)